MIQIIDPLPENIHPVCLSFGTCHKVNIMQFCSFSIHICHKVNIMQLCLLSIHKQNT